MPKRGHLLEDWGCPASSEDGLPQVPRRRKGVIAARRYPLSWSDRCLAQPSTAQLLKRNLRDSSVLENNRLQARAECRFDGGYEARLDLDLVRQGAVDGGFKEVRVIEATKNGLRAFVESLALLLQLAKNLHPAIRCPLPPWTRHSARFRPPGAFPARLRRLFGHRTAPLWGLSAASPARWARRPISFIRAPNSPAASEAASDSP